MDEEMKVLRDNNTFSLTNLPEGKKAVGRRWVYTLKTNVDGSDKYKARYVAKGYSQQMGVDHCFPKTGSRPSAGSQEIFLGSPCHDLHR